MLTMTRAKLFKKDPGKKPNNWIKDVNQKQVSFSFGNREYHF